MEIMLRLTFDNLDGLQGVGDQAETAIQKIVDSVMDTDSQALHRVNGEIEYGTECTAQAHFDYDDLESIIDLILDEEEDEEEVEDEEDDLAGLEEELADDGTVKTYYVKALVSDEVLEVEIITEGGGLLICKEHGTGKPMMLQPGEWQFVNGGDSNGV